MEGSSRQQHQHQHQHTDRLQPPSPIDEECPPTPSPRTHTFPASPWARKADPERQSYYPPENQLHVSDPDLESGAVEQKAKRSMILGCSKSTFIIVVFFLVVIIAAAIGGGVGGSRFADKKSVGASVQARNSSGRMEGG